MVAVMGYASRDNSSSTRSRVYTDSVDTGTTCVKSGPRVKVHRLGEKLIYDVFETEWLKQIGEGLQARTPSNRFLINIIHLTVVNRGAEMEDQDVANWLGMIRNLKPANTWHSLATFIQVVGST
jgi:hypothetical protein